MNPKDWHGGRRAVTLFYDNLSTFFPPGERFFMASVKAFRNEVKDEARQILDAAVWLAAGPSHAVLWRYEWSWRAAREAGHRAAR